MSNEPLTVLHAVVTAEYEDQRTLCLFADEADAAAYAATVNAGPVGGYVEVWASAPPFRAGVKARAGRAAKARPVP